MSTSSYFGSDEFSTIIHEFGHTLGLKHGHETSPNGALARDFDNHQFSVMTYRTYIGSPFDPIQREADGSVAAELHDVRHLGAAVDVRRELQPARQAGHLSLERHDRPGAAQRPAGAQHRPQRDRQDLLDDLDAGRRSDLRPQQLHPGPGRRPAARPLAHLLLGPARRPQVRQHGGGVQGPGQHLQRAALPGRPAVGHRQPRHRQRQRHADRQRPRQRAEGRRRHRQDRHRRRQRHGERRRRRRHDPVRRRATRPCATAWPISTATW